MVAHRRCGKTVACVNDIIKRAVLNKRQWPAPKYAYVGPLLKQSKEVAWSYLKWYSRPILKAANESDLFVELTNGAIIRIYGADNPDALRGVYLDGTVLDEYADMRPSLWGTIIRPMLTDFNGWATFIGTPRGHNQFHGVMYGAEDSPSGEMGAVANPDWYHTTLRASETGLVSDAELIDLSKTMTQEEYDQEFECSFEAAIKGAYFGKEMAAAEQAGRVGDVPYEPGLPVYTAWDLGMGDSTAIWFWQVVGSEIRVIDHYENHGQGLPHYAEVLESRGYVYEDDYVPHDARVRELGTGRTRVETLTQLRRRPRLVPDHRVMDGINAARLTLPRVWFDRTRCREGIEALKQYRADYDEKTRAFKDTPKHDWTSHSADAFRYLCMAWRELAPPSAAPIDPIKAMIEHKPTLDEMIKEIEDAREDAA